MIARGLQLAGLLSAALSLTAAPPLRAQAPQPAELLARMAESLQSLEYEGTFVYVHDGRVDAVRVSRTLGPEGPVDRLLTLSGDRREVVRERGELRCLTPGGTVSAATDLRRGLLASQPEQLRGLAEHYRFTIAGVDRVAGFDATVLDALPLDAQRYAHRLWLERASGMLLASMLRAPDGAPVEQLAFTELRIRQSTLHGSGTAMADIATAPAAPAPSRWAAPGLPPGFRLVARPPAPAGSEHLLYSDGLASVSIYIEPPGGGLLGPSRRGAVNAFGRALADAHVVVIGDLPAPTVAAIAVSLERAE
jgi:sigma-E factor negative regulatory protein RseB